MIGLLLFSCNTDDDTDTSTEMVEVPQVIPRVAILGTDLTDNTGPHLITWDAMYVNNQTDFLPELLAYDFGRIKNVVGNRIGVETIFPESSFVLYDIENQIIERHPDFFTPENEVGNFFTLNTDDKVATYYLDNNSTCCNVFLHSYDLSTESATEFFLGNLDVSPVQFNTFVRNNKAFLTGIDTFTGAKRLFVHDLESNFSLGTLDISEYEGLFYNDQLEQVYLVDFEADALSYDILELDFFSINSSDTFIAGVTTQSNFNTARFENGKMIFKQLNSPQSSVPLDAIFDFATNTLIAFEGTELFNSIAEQTGVSISIIDTEVDLLNDLYIVSGTFQEDGLTQGLLVFMTFDQEVVLSVSSGEIRPDEIIVLN